MTTVRVIALDRPVTDYARVDYSSDAYKQSPAHRKYLEYLAEKEAEWAEFGKTWTPPPPSSDDEDGFEASAVEKAAFSVWKLRRQGRVAAATAPYWHDCVHELVMGWGYGDESGLLAREPTAASVTLPFIMHGGKFSVTFTTEQYRRLSPSHDRDSVRLALESNKRLRVKSEHGVHVGELIAARGHLEMHWEVVSMPEGTPQDVADRVARAWSAIVAVDYDVMIPEPAAA